VNHTYGSYNAVYMDTEPRDFPELLVYISFSQS